MMMSEDDAGVNGDDSTIGDGVGEMMVMMRRMVKLKVFSLCFAQIQRLR